MERLVELVQRSATERAQRFVGRTMEVLVEGPSRTDPSQAARPHPPQQDRELHRRRPARRARRGRDRLRHEHDARRRGEPARAGRLSAPRGHRALRPDRGRQDGRRRRAGRALRERRGPGRDLGRRAAGLRGPARSSPAPRARPSGAARAPAASGSCRSTATFSVGEFMPLAHAEIDAALAAGRHADRRGRHRPVPARGAVPSST